MEESKSNHKLIICVRHGQRSDHAGLTPQLHISDPELTDKGKKQAQEIGKILNHSLKKKYKLEEGKKIIVISSPFARTLQTSKHILSGFEGNDNVDNKIYVDHLLCEHMEESFQGRVPLEFLSLYTQNSDYFLEEIKGVDIEFLNEKELLPVFEKEEDVYQRLGKCVENTIEKVLSRDDIGVVIMVSHASPLDQLNKVLGHPGPYGWKLINYCSSFVYSVDLSDKNSKFMERLDVILEK